MCGLVWVNDIDRSALIGIGTKSSSCFLTVRRYRTSQNEYDYDYDPYIVSCWLFWVSEESALNCISSLSPSFSACVGRVDDVDISPFSILYLLSVHQVISTAMSKATEKPDRDSELGTLIVVLLKARNLNDKYSFRKQDVFAQASLNSGFRQRSISISTC